MERNHCRIKEPEILNQVIGLIGFFNCYYRSVERGRDGMEFFPQEVGDDRLKSLEGLEREGIQLG